VFTTIYALNAVRHKHPIVNGNGGWRSMLQEFLGASSSPLRTGQTTSVLRGIRAIGVRYVMLHPATFRDPDLAARLEQDIHDATDQVVEERRFGDTWAWRLADAAPEKSAPQGQPVDVRTLTLHASHHDERLASLVDGDPGTRWFTGDRQAGGEFIEIHLTKPTDVARLRFESAPRSMMDFPRRLAVIAIDTAGGRQRLFDGDIVAKLIEALATDEQHLPVDIILPPNSTSMLRIEQTGERRTWWSIHELQIWSR
jgi:hypothetical protein